VDDDVETILLELDAWDKATSDIRLAIVLALAKTLPASFEFSRLATYVLGGQSHEIGFFRFENSEFALLPGRSKAILGYERDNPWQPNPAQLSDWERNQNEYGVSLQDYLDQYLSVPRQVQIEPLLIEVSARPHEYGQDGDNQVAGYAQVLASCGDGFRLPTTDEWEYACAAGTRSLFRWGNSCPISNSYDEKDWQLHRHANAFGLLMNSSTYDSEICHGPKLRGGDGGGSVCGGIGNIITWIPFASSFRVPDDEIVYWWIDEVHVRRVRSLNTSA
jgi:hypothetical protein